MTRRTIAIVGDYSEKVTAHRAIPRALELAREGTKADVDWDWVATRGIGDAHRDLAGYAAVWLAPASPYENTQGAIDAVRWAREGGRPFLGTCGGFQHMLLEFARNVVGILDADHAESNPGGSALILTPLGCSLVEKSGAVHFARSSLLGAAYGAADATEEYRCNYGFNPVYRPAFEASGLRFTSWDDEGEIRGAELASHPFFAGVLFQPERAALRGEAPPLALAFVKAIAFGQA
jgi:CTP synthase (UTP-ammonia lyase)